MCTIFDYYTSIFLGELALLGHKTFFNCSAITNVLILEILFSAGIIH